MSSNWIYRGQVVEEAPEGAVGMVYRITRISDGKFYIGKKGITSTHKKAIGIRAQKKQLEETGDKRRVKRVQRITTETKWRHYWGSCTELQENIKELGESAFHREILHWCWSKKNTTYYELLEQFTQRVLETDTWNNNINGSIFRKDVINPNI